MANAQRTSSSGASARVRRIAEGECRAGGRGCRCIVRRKHIYAQVIDDAKGMTLAAASTLEKDAEGRRSRPAPTRLRLPRSASSSPSAPSRPASPTVVFDRGAYIYHGRVKALADAAREGGLKF